MEQFADEPTLKEETAKRRPFWAAGDVLQTEATRRHNRLECFCDLGSEIIEKEKGYFCLESIILCSMRWNKFVSERVIQKLD